MAKNGTAAELERLSAAAVEAMSQRDWDFNKTPEAREVFQHIAPDWSACFDNFPGILNLSEQISAHRALFEQSPSGYYEIRSMSTTIEEGASTASVFLEIIIKNIGNLTLNGMSEFRWRLSGEKWLWYYHVAMRGISSF